MFDQTFVNTQAQTGRPWTLAVSVTLQTALVATMLIVPLFRVPKLDLPGKFQFNLPIEMIALKEKPKPVQQQTSAAQTHTVSTPRPVFQQPFFPIPTRVPRGIANPDAPEIFTPGSTVFTEGTPALSGLGDIRIAPPQRVRETPPAKPETPAQIHVGGAVQAGNLIYAPKPVYPRIAVIARTQGTVHIQAIIERDGTIGNLKVLSGPPLLVNAALDAVRQWRYKPTLLNGEPVEVVTEIDVNFALN